MAYGGATAAGAAAAIAQAIKASGAIVRVEPDDFLLLLSRAKANKPLVVIAQGGAFKKNYQYLTSYKGLVFFTKADAPLQLPGDTEIIAARQIWIPG